MKHRAVPCLILAAFLAALLSCAPRQNETIQPAPAQLPRVPASDEARAIYAYLSYRELMNEDKMEEAALALEEVIAFAPTPELYMELGNIYWRTSRYADAVATLGRATEKFPDSDMLIRTLAKTYASQGRFDDAVSVLDEYHRKHPDMVDLVHEAAMYRMEQLRFDEAASRLQAIPANRTSAITDFLLGRAYSGQDMPDKAASAYERAVAADPEYFDALIELGHTYEALNRLPDAEQVFVRLLDAGLESQQVIYRLVDLRLKLNRPDQALATILQYNYDESLTLESANLFLRQGFYDHAAQLLEPMLQESPIPVSAYLYLAILEYEGRDNPDQALTYLEAIPEDHAHHERSLIFRVHLLYQRGDKDGALELCKAAIDRYPAQPEFQIVLAEIHERSRDFPNALDVLLQANKRWPDNTTILYRLGLIYEYMDHKDQAMIMMEKILSRDSEHADALNFLGYSLAEMGRDLERAVLLIEGALRIDPDNGYYVDSLAWAYYKQGKLGMAWQEIKRAVTLVASDPVIWEHYGDIARDLKFLDQARKGYTRALELEPDNVQELQDKLKSLRRPR